VNLSDPQSFSSASPSLWRRYGGYIIGAVGLVVAAGVIWYLLSGTASTKREVVTPPMVMLPPPPPPPPEPEKLPEPEVEKVEPEIVETEPTPVETPSESEPTPDQAVGDAVTIDGEAQAGTDAFGIRSGSGGGMTGGGGGFGSFNGYVANELQQILARDPRTRKLVFNDIRVHVWLDSAGKVQRAELVKQIGDKDIEEVVLATVRDYRSANRPPSTATFPLLLTLKGARS
jgi:protein TonB